MVLITAQDAAVILGVAVTTVYDLVRRGQVQRRPHPYWATTSETAVELGVTPSAVRQMMLADRLPYVGH